ncbi:hypothetical protein [Candidatus Hodgkinia cicadicola]|uniref:hypothetical protein n=1 Tax=Candidatus Hodgkinia cicadicola TaxID=573658 RepID=UPI0011BA6489
MLGRVGWSNYIELRLMNSIHDNNWLIEMILIRQWVHVFGSDHINDSYGRCCFIRFEQIMYLQLAFRSIGWYSR